MKNKFLWAHGLLLAAVLTASGQDYSSMSIEQLMQVEVLFQR